MSLTMVRGPFGHTPAGSFNRDLPAVGTLFLDPFQRRVRGILDGEVVLDSTSAWMLHEHGSLPRLYFPPDDVRLDLLRSSTTITESATTGIAEWFDLVVGERRQAVDGVPQLRDIYSPWGKPGWWVSSDEAEFVSRL